MTATQVEEEEEFSLASFTTRNNDFKHLQTHIYHGYFVSIEISAVMKYSFFYIFIYLLPV